MTPRDLTGLLVDDEEIRTITFTGRDDSSVKVTPLTAFVFSDGTIMSEWILTEDERARILKGENIRLWMHTGGYAPPPVMLEVTTEADS